MASGSRNTTERFMRQIVPVRPAASKQRIPFQARDASEPADVPPAGKSALRSADILVGLVPAGKPALQVERRRERACNAAFLTGRDWETILRRFFRRN
jgi:hypothetical protein